METNAVRRDRHQRLLHPTPFGRGHMGSGPEQIMRGTETWGHACTIRKANGLLAVMALWAGPCVVYCRRQCLVPVPALFFFSELASPASSMMIRAHPDTGKFCTVHY